MNLPGFLYLTCEQSAGEWLADKLIVGDELMLATRKTLAAILKRFEWN